MNQSRRISLHWSEFSKNSVATFHNLQVNDTLADVTLCCEDQTMKCHKVVLSAGSIYLKETFEDCPGQQHPIVIMHNIDLVDLEALVTFMYQGKVNVNEDRLPTLFETAKFLLVKGLCEDGDGDGQPFEDKDGLVEDSEEGMKENVSKAEQTTGNVGSEKSTKTKKGKRTRTPWTKRRSTPLAPLSESFNSPLDLSQNAGIDNSLGEMSQRNPLIQLNNIMTEDGRFICIICGADKTFKNKNVLYNHRSVYHRNDPFLALGSTETIRLEMDSVDDTDSVA